MNFTTSSVFSGNSIAHQLANMTSGEQAEFFTAFVTHLKAECKDEGRTERQAQAIGCCLTPEARALFREIAMAEPNTHRDPLAAAKAAEDFMDTVRKLPGKEIAYEESEQFSPVQEAILTGKLPPMFEFKAPPRFLKQDPMAVRPHEGELDGHNEDIYLNPNPEA